MQKVTMERIVSKERPTIILAVEQWLKKQGKTFTSVPGKKFEVIKDQDGRVYQYVGCHEAYSAYVEIKDGNFLDPENLPELLVKQIYYALYGDTMSYDGTNFAPGQVPIVLNTEGKGNKYDQDADLVPKIGDEVEVAHPAGQGVWGYGVIEKEISCAGLPGWHVKRADGGCFNVTKTMVALK